MNIWSALVLITMTLVVGAVAYFTGSTWALFGLIPVFWLGDVVLNNRPPQA